MGWVIALVILLLVGSVPLGIQIKYNEDGFLARVIAGFIRFTVFPLPKKNKKKTAQQSSKTEKRKDTAKAKKAASSDTADVPAKNTKGGSLCDFLPFVKLGFDLLKSFQKKLRVNRLDLKLILAGDDPCDLAVNYGRAWAAVSNLFVMLEKSFTIQDRNVEIECDFTANEILVTTEIDITITVGRILALGCIYGYRGVIEFIRFIKKRKGGASL